MTRTLWPGILAMAAIVVASNILVQFLFGQWLTWGAFTYQLAFLVTDLIQRRQDVLGKFSTLGNDRIQQVFADLFAANQARKMLIGFEYIFQYKINIADWRFVLRHDETSRCSLRKTGSQQC